MNNVEKMFDCVKRPKIWSDKTILRKSNLKLNSKGCFILLKSIFIFCHPKKLFVLHVNVSWQIRSIFYCLCMTIASRSWQKERNWIFQNRTSFCINNKSSQGDILKDWLATIICQSFQILMTVIWLHFFIIFYLKISLFHKNIWIYSLLLF